MRQEPRSLLITGSQLHCLLAPCRTHVGLRRVLVPRMRHEWVNEQTNDWDKHRKEKCFRWHINLLFWSVLPMCKVEKILTHCLPQGTRLLQTLKQKTQGWVIWSSFKKLEKMPLTSRQITANYSSVDCLCRCWLTAWTQTPSNAMISGGREAGWRGNKLKRTESWVSQSLKSLSSTMGSFLRCLKSAYQETEIIPKKLRLIKAL